jgi:hypothetical protein
MPLRMFRFSPKRFLGTPTGLPLELALDLDPRDLDLVGWLRGLDRSMRSVWGRRLE